MNATARLLLAALAALGIAALSGCASHPEQRPYTAEETRQLQLEALQRRGLSQQEYEHQRAAILRADQVEVAGDGLRQAPALRG